MSLTTILDMACAGLEDRVVVGPRSTGLTAGQLKGRAEAGARLARAAGADAIVYVGSNGLAMPVALFSAALAGVPFVPLNYRLGAAQLEAMLANHPGALLIADKAGVPLPVETPPRWSPEEWLDLTRDGERSPVDRPGGDEDRIAVIIYTSGSTATPKGVVLRDSQLSAYVFGTVDFASADEDEASLMSVPPYHIAAVANILTSLFAGRRLINIERFEAAEWLDLVRAEAITHALVVPTMLGRVVESGCDLDVPSLRSLAYGGAPMPRRIVERALRLWPEVDFVNAYGLTETSSTICVLTPEDHRTAITSSDPVVQATLSSVGRPLPGIELEIRSHEDRAVVPDGAPGRVWVRGDQIAAQYADATPALDERGFFDTRDDGLRDQLGFIHILGRSDDTIIRGAENIAPAEIEEVLLSHPAVLDAAVVGVPDPEWGQRIVAVVELRPGDPTELSEPEAQEFVRSRLRGSKTPDHVLFWTQIPRTETGKLIRREVADAVGGQVSP